MADESYFKSQTEILSVVLKKLNGGSSFDLMSEEKGVRPFQRLVLSESLWEPSVSGTIFLIAKNSEGELFNINGFELLEVTIKTPITAVDLLKYAAGGPLGWLFNKLNDRQTFKFHITKVTEISDSAALSIEGVGGPSTVYALDFQPFEVQFFDKQNPLESEEFIGKIAGEDGFVDYLATKFFNPDSSDYSSASQEMDIEPSFNSIWYKSTQAAYPYGKQAKRMDLGQLMNNLAENAVSADNPSAANYLFWQDLNQWHFRSLESLIVNQSGEREYEVKFGDPGKQSIDSFTFTKKLNQRELMISQAYKSFYNHISPIYYDPYSDYLSTTSKLNKTTVTYDYTRDYERWAHIEEYPLLPDVLTNPDSDGGEIKDQMYGYFNLGEFNDPSPTKLDHAQSTNKKNSMSAWQTMFDQTDLSIDTIKTIRNDIFLPTQEARLQYALSRMLKEKWNVYKYSICCEDQPVVETEEVGLGMIVHYNKSEDSYYWDYRVAPIELWTNDATVEQERILNSTFPASPFLIAAKGMTGEGENYKPTTVLAYNITEIFNGPKGSGYGVRKYDFSETYSSESHKPEEQSCGVNGETENIARNFNDLPCFCNDSSPCDQAIPDPCCYPCGGAPSSTNQGDFGLCQWCQPDWVDPSNPCNVPGGECGDYPSGEPSVAYCNGASVVIDTVCNFCCGLASGQVDDYQAMQPCCAGSPDDGTLTCRTINGELVYPLCSEIQGSPSYDPEFCGEDAEWLCCPLQEVGTCCPTVKSYYDYGYRNCSQLTELECNGISGDFLGNGSCEECPEIPPEIISAGCCECVWETYGYCNQRFVATPTEDGDYDYSGQEQFVANCENDGGTVIFNENNDPLFDPCSECTAEVSCPDPEPEECCFEGFGGLTFDYYRQFDRYKYDSVIGAAGSLPSVTGGSTFDCVRFEQNNSGGFEIQPDGSFDPFSPHPNLKGTIVRLYRIAKNSLDYIEPNEYDEKEYIYFFEAEQPVNHLFRGEHMGISCGFDNPEAGELPAIKCGIKLPPSDELPPLDSGGFNA